MARNDMGFMTSTPRAAQTQDTQPDQFQQQTFESAPGTPAGSTTTTGRTGFELQQANATAAPQATQSDVGRVAAPGWQAPTPAPGAGAPPSWAGDTAPTPAPPQWNPQVPAPVTPQFGEDPRYQANAPVGTPAPTPVWPGAGGNPWSTWNPNAAGENAGGQGFVNEGSFWLDPTNQQGMAAWANSYLPYLNAQNQWQMSQQQFDQNNQQWLAEFMAQQNQNQFGQQLSAQQQQWQQYLDQVAANQWGQQFAFETGMAQNQFGMEQQQQYWNQGFQQQQQQLDQMWRDGQLSNDQYRNETQRLQIENQQRQFMSQFGLDQQQMLWNQGFQQSQLAQQAQLERERMANALQQAQIQATGRSQRPTARWIRSFG